MSPIASVLPSLALVLLAACSCPTESVGGGEVDASGSGGAAVDSPDAGETAPTDCAGCASQLMMPEQDPGLLCVDAFATYGAILVCACDGACASVCRSDGGCLFRQGDDGCQRCVMSHSRGCGTFYFSCVSDR